MNAITRTNAHAQNNGRAPVPLAALPPFDEWLEVINRRGSTSLEELRDEKQAFEQFFGYPVNVNIYPEHATLHIRGRDGDIIQEFNRRDFSFEGNLRAVAAYLLMVMRLRGEAWLFIKVNK